MISSSKKSFTSPKGPEQHGWSKRNKTNTIEKVKDGNGDFKDDEKRIAGILNNYFSTLFSLLVTTGCMRYPTWLEYDYMIKW